MIVCIDHFSYPQTKAFAEPNFCGSFVHIKLNTQVVPLYHAIFICIESLLTCISSPFSPFLLPSLAIDGDGMIVGLTFVDGRVHLRTRFVDSRERMEEHEQKKFLYRGQMGTHPNSALKDTAIFLKHMLTLSWPKLQYRNPSNTNVFYWGGKVC